jgi:hypothetical protein
VRSYNSAEYKEARLPIACHFPIVHLLILLTLPSLRNLLFHANLHFAIPLQHPRILGALLIQHRLHVDLGKVGPRPLQWTSSAPQRQRIAAGRRGWTPSRARVYYAEKTDAPASQACGLGGDTNGIPLRRRSSALSIGPENIEICCLTSPLEPHEAPQQSSVEHALVGFDYAVIDIEPLAVSIERPPALPLRLVKRVVVVLAA